MIKRLTLTWAAANFVFIGLASWAAGAWYLGWAIPPAAKMLAELGLLMAPNLVLPVLLLRRAWPEPVGSLREALGWRWYGWRSLAVGGVTFGVVYVLGKGVGRVFGESIPYHLPGAEEGGMVVQNMADALMLLGLLLGLLAFAGITIAAEETMFRGLIQTQVGLHWGVGIGLLAGALAFGLRHLPADLFYASAWQATPQMWLARQAELYLAAAGLGLARHFGRSTYASAVMHALLFFAALTGL